MTIPVMQIDTTAVEASYAGSVTATCASQTHGLSGRPLTIGLALSLRPARKAFHPSVRGYSEDSSCPLQSYFVEAPPVSVRTEAAVILTQLRAERDDRLAGDPYSRTSPPTDSGDPSVPLGGGFSTRARYKHADMIGLQSDG
ncbi:hypothetical protein DL93DRAFT_2173981 [Clavulina sp. PMI_390]|nr:hypothetical protein DL93DRAFT_2173981 [Clavulina sp. PMI_390]